MKFTIDVSPGYDYFQVKELYQKYLKEDINAYITSIHVRFSKYWDFSISGLTLTNWARELGLAVEVKFPKRKEHVVYIVRRITGQDDITKDKLLEELRGNENNKAQ